MNSHSVFAYVYNPNAIEIVARGRIWPGLLTTAIFKKKVTRGKKIKGLLFNTENFQTRVRACHGHGW